MRYLVPMIKGILFDIEGTLVKDKRHQAVPGAVEFVRARRAGGVALRLITNNTTDRPAEIVRKLHAAGFDVRVDELFACTTAAIEALATLRRCYLIGTPPLFLTPSGSPSSPSRRRACRTPSSPSPGCRTP